MELRVHSVEIIPLYQPASPTRHLVTSLTTSHIQRPFTQQLLRTSGISCEEEI